MEMRIIKPEETGSEEFKEVLQKAKKTVQVWITQV
jgi:hypothetical protein